MRNRAPQHRTAERQRPLPPSERPGSDGRGPGRRQRTWPDRNRTDTGLAVQPWLRLRASRRSPDRDRRGLRSRARARVPPRAHHRGEGDLGDGEDPASAVRRQCPPRCVNASCVRSARFPVNPATGASVNNSALPSDTIAANTHTRQSSDTSSKRGSDASAAAEAIRGTAAAMSSPPAPPNDASTSPSVINWRTTRAAGAEGGANRHLPPSRLRPRQEQRRDVGAGNQQHEQHRRKQNHQCRTHATEHVVVHVHHVERPLPSAGTRAGSRARAIAPGGPSPLVRQPAARLCGSWRSRGGT